MSNRIRLFAAIALALLANTLDVRAAEPSPEIVVAIRYLQQAGVSHSHLYLYRADGKLLRQLTKDDSGQDRNPVFAPDGATVVFTRELPGGNKQWWSVEPRGGNLRRLDAAPDWYQQTKTSPAFGNDLPPDGGTTSEGGPDGSITYSLPDDLGKLTLAPTPDTGGQDSDDWAVKWRRAGAAVETEVGGLPGFSPGWLACRVGDTLRTVLSGDGFQAVFLSTYLGSTDGNTVHALDFGRKKLVRLSPNWAEVLPLPGEPALLVGTEERYVPFGDGKHTANCSYIDRWSADWKKVRYAREKAPAVSYGASTYRPGKTPAVVTVHDDSELNP